MEESKELISELRRNPNYGKVTFQLFNIKDYHFCDPNYQCVCDPSKHTFKSRAKELSDDLSGKGENLIWKWKSNLDGKPELTQDKAEKTTYLALGWCWSFNGDVNLALRSNAEMSRLIMETNMKNIGIKGAKLSEEQKEFLEKATDEIIKDMFVEGK